MSIRRFIDHGARVTRTRVSVRRSRRASVDARMEERVVTGVIAPTADSNSGFGSGAGGRVPVVGTRIGQNGRFELLELIGRGGIAAVFRGYDRHLDRPVAVKVVREVCRIEPTFGHQLLFEARMTARLNHENIVTVHDTGRWRGMPFFIMEHVSGPTLDAHIARRPLSPPSALEIALQVASGVEHAHEAGVLHLDLKPSNVLLDTRGRAKVIDFGVAGFIASMRELSATDGPSPMFVGTPAYMAPEQWSMDRLDERTDVWGIGAVLFEMLEGRPLEVRRPTACGAPSSVERPLAGQASDLSAIVRRALERRPEDRFPTVREVREALRAVRLSLSPGTA